MALEMRSNCEKCTTALQVDAEAYICIHECTFCPACTEHMQHICPNCGNELVRRPRKHVQESCSLG